jgi:hypothetical protein
MNNPKYLKSVLARIAIPTNIIHYDAAMHLSKNFYSVVDFLGSDRFRGDPRQIANALAGAPRHWWTSLKIYQSEPCDFPIGNRALKA